jgi:3-oxoacyl-[acyl-carrier protein] reductase
VHHDPAPSSPGQVTGAAIVTGANHGIGAATARALAAAGHPVLVAGWPTDEDRDPAVPARYYEDRARHPDEIAAVIRQAGGDADSVVVDLLDDDAPARLFDHATDRFDVPVRILVHNASGWVGDTFDEAGTDHADRSLRAVSATTFDRQFGVDARAGALLIATFADRHRARGDDRGRIVTLTSGGPDGFPHEASYGAAKAALDNYVMTAAAELGALGITANAVLPPVTDTGWVTDPVREFVRTSWGHHHVAAADEVAEVVAWLCTDAARLVTGNRIVLR